MSIEAIKLMLAALEHVLDCINEEKVPFDGDDFHEALRLGRQAIAQAEQARPPVLTGIDCLCGKKWRIVNNTLTVSEPQTVMADYKFQTYAAYKKDGEMQIGVMPEPEQEPVAKVELMTTGGNAGLATRIVEIDDHLRERLRPGQLLYTAPPQRKPLTDEEIINIGKDARAIEGQHLLPVTFARAIEAAHGIGGNDA